MRLALPALALAATLTALGGCSPQQAWWPGCRAAASDTAQLQRKLDACAAVIGAGAKGGDLEDALRIRGETYNRLGDAAKALASFNQAIALKTDDAQSLIDRGLVLLNQNELDKALLDLDQAIRLDPANGDAYDGRGVIEHRKGAYDAAIADESQAIELKPSLSSLWVNRGYAYLGKREYEMALADFADALRLDADDAAAYAGRAYAERAKGQPDAAINDYGEAIKRNGGDADAHEGRAALLEARGDASAAAKDYAAASDAYLQKRDYRRALDLADRAIALSPDDPEALNERCWTRGVANAEIEGALADCQRSLALRPRSAETLDSLAFVYFRQGRWDAAVSGYNAALEQNSTLPTSLFMRGVAELRQGDQAAGERDIEAAKQADANVAAQFASYGVTP